MKQLEVLLIEENGSNELLERILCKYDFGIFKLEPELTAIDNFFGASRSEIVIFNTQSPDENILNCIRHINQAYPVPVVIFAEDQDNEVIDRVIKEGVSAYVVDGLQMTRVKAVIAVATARFKEHQRLKEELKKTKLKLEERKILDKAKAILIKTQGFSEDTAYHTLRKLAMERNLSIGEMAKNVISMADLLSANS